MEKNKINKGKNGEFLYVGLGKRIPTQLRFNYDPEGDVLYISFGKPKPADDAYTTDQGDVVRVRQCKVVGLTVIGFQKRMHLQEAALSR